MQAMGLPYNDDFNDGDQYGVGTAIHIVCKRCLQCFLKSKTNNKNLN